MLSELTFSYPSTVMLKFTITLHPAFTIDKTDPRLFGGFIEHLGRAVYDGIYEPDHPGADADGFRSKCIT